MTSSTQETSGAPGREPRPRELGAQPLAALMARHGVEAPAVVAASTAQLTHKMVARAVKGRRLTPKSKAKVLAAFNAATGQSYERSELFNY